LIKANIRIKHLVTSAGMHSASSKLPVTAFCTDGAASSQMCIEPVQSKLEQTTALQDVIARLLLRSEVCLDRNPHLFELE
jgi:hypothetical protein